MGVNKRTEEGIVRPATIGCNLLLLVRREDPAPLLLAGTAENAAPVPVDRKKTRHTTRCMAAALEGDNEWFRRQDFTMINPNNCFQIRPVVTTSPGFVPTIFMILAKNKRFGVPRETRVAIGQQE